MTQQTYRGLPCCSCQAEWLPVFEQELRERDLIKDTLHLAQLIGGAEKSKGVHLGGGCADWWETDVRIAQVAREMGAPATWPRTGVKWIGNEHTHSGLRGCPHMTDAARQQVIEVDKGGDGLLGDVADPLVLRPFHNDRNWRQGIAWAKRQQLRRAKLITFGTHNTLDGKADESGFADVIIFTEAIPAEIRRELEKTHKVWACQDQKDLVLAVHKRLEPKMVDQEYHKAHGGIVLVTPKRGTWKTELELLGVPVDGIWEHRINAAFPPFIRGERLIRPRFWKKHTRITKDMIRESKNRKRVILAGGDPNTPKHVTAYGNTLAFECGDGKDRIASNRRITEFQVLSRDDSDHHKLRGTVQLP
jgi:hypothetical protein